GVRDAEEEHARDHTFASFGASSAVASARPSAPPIACAATNAGTSLGSMPANVSVSARASVTAGLANEVDDVNQYAEVMYAPTAYGVASGRWRGTMVTTSTSPSVATTSP